MTRAIVAGALLGLALASGCGVFGGCDAPDKPEYTCEPVALGTPNTCPGPMVDGTTYDEDKAFPAGCTVSLPVCIEGSQGETKKCDCYPGDSYPWVCPL